MPRAGDSCPCLCVGRRLARVTCPAALDARRVASGGSVRAFALRQVGPGLGSPARWRLNPAWTAGFRGLRSFCGLRALAVLSRSMTWLADRGLTTATTRLACDPSPGPPCRVGACAFGSGGVSRPVEGLDNFGAVRTLRIGRPLASARTLRVRVSPARCGTPGAMRRGAVPRTMSSRAKSQTPSWSSPVDPSKRSNGGPDSSTPQAIARSLCIQATTMTVPGCFGPSAAYRMRRR